MLVISITSTTGRQTVSELAACAGRTDVRRARGNASQAQAKISERAALGPHERKAGNMHGAAVAKVAGWKLIAALVAVMGAGLAHPVAPAAQLGACESSVAAFVNRGGDLARHTDAGIRHNCDPRAGLSRWQVRDAERFAVRWVTLHNS
jgi:hypothetical protein